MTKLDDMLSKWPTRPSTQLEADEAGERVVAAIQAGQLPASIDESILAAPLPKTPEEEQTSGARTSRPGRASSGMGVESKMSKDRTRERTSFQELAKMATTPPPPTSSATGSGPNRSSLPTPLPSPASSSGSSGVVRGDEASSTDSGIVDLKAIASADPSGSQRAQSTPLASSGLFEDESAPPKPAISPGAAEKLASTPPPSSKSAAPAVAQTAAAAVAKKPEEQKSGGGLVIAIGALFAAGAIAAGVVMFVKWQHNKAAMAALANNATPTAVVAASDNKPKAQATSATPTASVAQADNVQDLPDTVETVQNGTGKPTYRFHAKPGAGGGGGATNAAPDPATAGTVDPKLIANVPTGPAGGGGGDLAEAMKTAAGGGTGLGSGGGGDGPKAGNPNGSVPQRPSQGQVAGAVGSVMPGAKACLGADEPMSRASITFQSDGTVKSVSVTGFAAGKPQEACIKTALSKATVTPFAEATYSIPVTIRSN